MRITFVGAEQISGGARVIATHARLLARRGHDVTVLMPRRPRPSIRSGLRNLLRNGHWVSPQASGSNFFAGVDVRMVSHEELISGSAFPDADVVIATWWSTAEWIHSAPPEKGAKVHFVQGHEMFDNFPADRVRAVYRLPIPKIVVSNWLKEIMRIEYGTEDVMLVPNAVDLEMFDAEPRGKQPTMTCGFVYSPESFKGVRSCIEALEQAKRIAPGLRAVSFGKAPPDDRLALPSWIEFSHSPPQSTIRDIYANCDAWLFPSISEGFGLPILEAMACRTPVIGTAAGAGADYIDDTTGALVDGSPASFVEQIVRFIKMDQPEWQSISEGARRRVEDYTWKDAAEAFDRNLNAIMVAG